MFIALVFKQVTLCIRGYNKATIIVAMRLVFCTFTFYSSAGTELCVLLCGLTLHISHFQDAKSRPLVTVRNVHTHSYACWSPGESFSYKEKTTG